MGFTCTYRRCRLRPRGRAVDRAAVGERHHVRQLAARRQVAGDVRVVGGDSVQMLGVGWGRIKMQGACASRPRPLRRIGRASRVDINPLKGSVGSLPHHDAWRNEESSFLLQWPQPEGWSHAPLRQNLAAGLVRVYHIVMLGARGTNKFSQSTSKMRSQALRPKTPFRVGRTVRLDMNPLTGSVGSVPHRRAWRKGGREKR